MKTLLQPKFLAAFILLTILICLQYRVWFESGGMLDVIHLKKQLRQQTQENDQLKQRNLLLIQQVAHLQKNNSAIESRARDELGMIKKNETFYQVVK